MSSLVLHSRSFHSELAPDPEGPLPANLLGCVRFGLRLPPRPPDPRRVDVGLGALDDPALAELWVSDRPVEHGAAEGFSYAHNGEVLFGHMRLEESELADLERATLKAYVRMEWFLQHLGYPCWLRMWNFLARINEGTGDAERYRLFSAGRHRALALKPGFENMLPAATAIGTLDSGLVIYFIAGKHSGQQVENPRQVSAFRYPRQYGPRSPSFSRATLLHHESGARLLVSGTASVVGHESLHLDDPPKQLEETAANIQALLGQALKQRGSGVSPEDVAPEQLKVYVRDPALLPGLREQTRALFGADAPMVWLQGDICRHDLLLEIEAIYCLPGD